MSSTIPSEKKSKLGLSKQTWTIEQSVFILHAWAANYQEINGNLSQSKKAWVNLLDSYNKNFIAPRTVLQLKRKIKYHIDMYTISFNWNKNHYGAERKECDYFDVLNSVLGYQFQIDYDEKIAKFEDLVVETTYEVQVENQEVISHTVPLPLATQGLEAGAFPQEPPAAEQDTANEASFEVLETDILEEERRCGEEERRSGEDHRPKLQLPIVKKAATKKAKQNRRAAFDAKLTNVLERLTKQGDALVSAVERMEENSRRQTEILRKLSRGMNLLLAGRARDKDRMKRQRLELSKTFRKDSSDDSSPY